MLRTSKYFLLFVVALAILAIPSATPAQIAVGISVHIGPPALPVYVQPVCPAPGYIWTPGYWAYGPDGYYWVPGTWVMAPTPGLLWTPGYWGWFGGAYVWHVGYWGPHVGFYGGINYGFGYGGVGFVGGEWRGGAFHYNTAVTNVNTTVIHNTYVNKTVINNNTTVNRVSYNGGTGGVTAQPTAAEQAVARENHVAPTSLQAQHEQAARNDRNMRASVNGGRPAVAATPKPGVFHGPGVVAARAAGANPAVKTDRPSSARTNSATNASTNKPHTNTSSGNRPNTNSSNTQHTNTSHSNTSKPPQQPKPSHPAPHEHESSGKPGGHGR